MSKTLFIHFSKEDTQMREKIFKPTNHQGNANQQSKSIRMTTTRKKKKPRRKGRERGGREGKGRKETSVGKVREGLKPCRLSVGM